MLQDERYFRAITDMVMQKYCEFAEGFVPAPEGRVFDTRLLDYRVDVELVMDKLGPQAKAVILDIYVNGATQVEALRNAGLATNERPGNAVARIETKLGRLLDRAMLSDILAYLR